MRGMTETPGAVERVDPPLAAGETSTLVAFLNYHRDTLRLKTEGLDAAGLDTRLAPSTITLGGLLKHLALVEDQWFSVVLLGNEPAEPRRDVDWDADRDWEWHTASQDTPERLRRLLDDAIDASDRCLGLALSDDGLDQLSVRESRREGGRLSLRWILVHMIEEYARHNGHADLIRESVDGVTGE